MQSGKIFLWKENWNINIDTEFQQRHLKNIHICLDDTSFKGTLWAFKAAEKRKAMSVTLSPVSAIKIPRRKTMDSLRVQMCADVPERGGSFRR